MSVNVRTGVHVTHKQEAATPHCQEAPTTPYTQVQTKVIKVNQAKLFFFVLKLRKA